MKLLAILFIFTFGFVAVNAIKCYQCLSLEGSNVSDSSCQSNPNSSLSQICGFIKNKGPHDVEICTTLTGFVDGKPIVNRGCVAVSLIDAYAEYDGNCIEVPNIIEINVIKKSATGAKVCYCATDNCNGSSTASFHHQYFWITLFALAVQLWYKFVKNQ